MLQVARHVTILLQQHSPEETPPEVDVFDVAEIGARALLDERKGGGEHLVVVIARFHGRCRAEALQQPGGNFCRRQYLVGQTCVDCSNRHAIVGRGGRRLHQHQPAAGLEVHDARGTVAAGAGAGKNDSRGLDIGILRHRGQADVDGQMQSGGALRDPEMAIERGQRRVLGQHVDRVELDLAQVRQPLHWHAGVALEDGVELGFPRGIQMTDHQHGKARTLGQPGQDAGARVDAARRTAQHGNFDRILTLQHSPPLPQSRSVWEQGLERTTLRPQAGERPSV